MTDSIRRVGLGQIVSASIVNQLKNIAKNDDVPYQLEVQAAGSTDFDMTFHLT